MAKFTILKILHTNRFKFTKTYGNRDVICERNDLVRARANYLTQIKKKYRAEDRVIVYTDETWVNAGHTKDKQWHPPDKRRDRGLPHNR